MTKINILTPGFTTPNGRAFLFPIIKNYHKLREQKLYVNFFDKEKNDLFDSDFLCIDSKFYKDQWLSNDKDTLNKIYNFKKRVGSLFFFDTTDSSSWIHNDMLNISDKYLKSQILKNKKLYTKSFYGNRIYSDYYHKNFSINDKNIVRSIPVNKNLLNKIEIFWNTGLADYSLIGPALMKLYNYIPTIFLLKYKKYKPIRKTIDINCRMGISYGRKSISFQREKIKNIFKGYISNNKINRIRYFNELRKSKIVISPFGWGEITLKDFETFLTQGLLIKPSMDHLDTWPNFYYPNKSFIPFSWDLKDLHEKIIEILENFSLYNDIACWGRENYLYFASENASEAFIKRFKNIFIK